MTLDQTKQLWRLLAQTWGSKFTEQYGPTPNEAWSAALENASVGEAKYALHKLIDEASPFPPTLPEFIGYVRKARRPSQVRHDANGRAYLGDEPPLVALPPRVVDLESARENIRRLRETLNGVLKDAG